MIEILRKKRNRDELAKVHPAFRHQFELVLDDTGRLGRPRLQDTWRTAKQQEAKVANGLSLVTVSPHMNTLLVNGRERPASLAIHVLNDDAPLAPSYLWMATLAVSANRRGLTSGLAWAKNKQAKTAPGTLHRKALDAAIEAGDVDKLVKLLYEGVGFDPLHVEVRGWRRFYGVDKP